MPKFGPELAPLAHWLRPREGLEAIASTSASMAACFLAFLRASACLPSTWGQSCWPGPDKSGLSLGVMMLGAVCMALLCPQRDLMSASGLAFEVVIAVVMFMDLAPRFPWPGPSEPGDMVAVFMSETHWPGPGEPGEAVVAALLFSAGMEGTIVRAVGELPGLSFRSGPEESGGTVVA